jgi:hypothetical protein
MEKQLQITNNLIRGKQKSVKGPSSTTHRVKNVMSWLCSSDNFAFEREERAERALIAESTNDHWL